MLSLCVGSIIYIKFSLRESMTDKRQWTVEEDRLLKYVFETSGLSKWSHIARKLQEEYGVKGRNGKQCKERYTTHIDTSHPKEEWSYDDQQKMFELHNELGNKWAIIGGKLGGRTDNCVKNHFYSRLRKALRKINKVIQDNYRKQIKQIKPNVLYRIVEASEQKFKLFPSFDKDFSMFANHLKNQLLQFSYDDELEEANELTNINVEATKVLIDKIAEFGLNYKKKAKKQRKNSGQGQDLLTPNRYQRVKKCNSQNEQSEGSSIHLSSQTSNIDDISDDDVSRSNDKKYRKNSMDSANDDDDFPAARIRTRALSHGNARHRSLQIEMKDQKLQQQEQPNGGNFEQNLGIQGILQGLKILQQDENLPPHPMLMKKQTSKYSRYSQNMIEQEQYHFFEDSQIEMRILPEMQMGLHRDSQLEENIFN